jgi:ketosteroid isomerase-like protein
MSAKETIRKYFECINEEKFDELFSLFCEDVEFSCPVNFKVQGLEKMKRFYLKVPENYPEHNDQPIDILIVGNRASVLIQFDGKNKEGIPISFIATDWFTFEGDKIKTLNIFYDSLALSRSSKKGT